jgi:FixJ family two-component response regulator
MRRVAKLEAKRRLRDNDLSRLSDDELDARIMQSMEALIAQYGDVDAAIEAVRNGAEDWDLGPEQRQVCIECLKEYQATQKERKAN